MTKSCMGVYCDKGIYSVLLSDTGKIETKFVEKHEGRLRHFKFIKYLKGFDALDLTVIVQNDEAVPIINYLRREKKRPYVAIEYSPISNQANYRENPDLPTIARKLDYRRKLGEIEFSEEHQDLAGSIEGLGDGSQAIHMRSLDGFVLACMAASHGIFGMND